MLLGMVGAARVVSVTTGKAVGVVLSLSIVYVVIAAQPVVEQDVVTMSVS
jgi:hypothetical protein